MVYSLNFFQWWIHYNRFWNKFSIWILSSFTLDFKQWAPLALGPDIFWSPDSPQWTLADTGCWQLSLKHLNIFFIIYYTCNSPKAISMSSRVAIFYQRSLRVILLAEEYYCLLRNEGSVICKYLQTGGSWAISVTLNIHKQVCTKLWLSYHDG